LQDIEAGADDEESEEELNHVDAWSAVFWLAVLTVFISLLSKYIVDAIEVSLWIQF
jgi:Ca2+/H+ antiporter